MTRLLTLALVTVPLAACLAEPGEPAGRTMIAGWELSAVDSAFAGWREAGLPDLGDCEPTDLRILYARTPDEYAYWCDDATTDGCLTWPEGTDPKQDMIVLAPRLALLRVPGMIMHETTHYLEACSGQVFSMDHSTPAWVGAGSAIALACEDYGAEPWGHSCDGWGRFASAENFESARERRSARQSLTNQRLDH